MSVKDVLQFARGRLVDGWCQGAFYKDVGGMPCGYGRAAYYCLAGAFNCAEGLYPVEERRQARLMVISLLERNGIKDGIAKWNDEQGRKKSEVIGLLDSVIAEADSCL